MRYLLLLFCSLLIIPFIRVNAQNSAPKPIKGPHASAISLKTRDSLSRIRFKKRRHLDSVKRIHLRDSLRAGYTIFFKGHSFSAKQVSGRRLADSLDHPSRFLKPKRVLTHLDSVSLKIKVFAEKNLLKAGDSSKLHLTRLPHKALLKPSDTTIISTGKLHPANRFRSADSSELSMNSQQQSSSPVDSTGRSQALVPAHSYTIGKKAEVFERVIDDSIPVFLQPLSANDTSANSSARFKAYILKHYKLDSVRQRISEINPALQSKEIIDPHRPFSRPGMNRNVRETWIVWVLLLMVSLITLIKVRFPKDLGDIVESLFNDRMIKSNRDAGLIYSPSFIFMFLCFCLTAALAIYEYIHFLHLNADYKGATLYLIMVACILGFLVCKLIIYRISAAVFNIDRMVQPYLSFQYITLANFTLFFIPFLVIFSFYNAVLLPHLVVWIPFIFLAFLLFMYIRSIVFFISNFELPKFYLFLYFCTLEVCPLIIVFKLING